MRDGDVLAGRFEIERLAGSGGMGRVYRAVDRVSGAPVAVKVVAPGGAHNERFGQEVRVLSGLVHPAVVRYVAHGTTPQGEPFLAMEWLEGEDLAQRLARAGLSVAESISVLRTIAAGLAMAHERGVIHRDVKPSNVFLVGGDASRAKLIDFGIVRMQLTDHGPTARPLTQTGMLMGTVGYMSPEQAVADPALDARSDVFALGCLLYECLAGEPAFTGAHLVAVLAKVLREEAPRVRQLRPELPSALDDLVARMLAKDRAERPADAGAVLRELEALGETAGGVPGAVKRSAIGLSVAEQRLVSVMLAVVPEDRPRVEAIVRRHGGDQARLANGALLVTLSSKGQASEQVVTAAACALELRDGFPSARIALATGRAQTTDGGPPGLVIDHAAALLARSPSPGIRVDEVTAGLLEPRFELALDGRGHVLSGRRRDVERPRTLLGKPTPFVGRDKELGLLALTLSECIEESVARVVLLTGPPGQGKSRLRHEFVSRARERGDVAVLTARADPVGAGGSFTLARRLVRHAAGLRDGDPLHAQQAALRAHVSGVCRASDAARVAELLGELIGVPSPDAPSAELLAARNDPQMMAVSLTRSFRDWLAGECAAHPLLMVLEDIHWGDAASVTYVGDALRALSGRPLMVLALARPEVYQVFPGLWAGTEKQEVALGRIAPRAAERLVRATLGEGVDAEAASRIVARADGNAFYLEELIRRVADGAGEHLPETVLALVQSRLERLDPDERRLVRAASVFGETFGLAGLGVLLGCDAAAPDLLARVASLCDREIVERRDAASLAGSGELAFRHALLREAAYAALTDEDRALGHRLAGEWLERTGEREASLVAEHFDRGGDVARASTWYRRASVQAVSRFDLAAALARADRAIELGATGEQLGRLLVVRAQAHFWNGAMFETEQAGREAMQLFVPGDIRRFTAATTAFVASTMVGGHEAYLPEIEAMLRHDPTPETRSAYLHATANQVGALVLRGELALARRVLDRMESLVEGSDDRGGWVTYARAFFALMKDAAPWDARLLALEAAERLGPFAGSNASLAHWVAAHAALRLGAAREAVTILDRELGSDGRAHGLVLAKVTMQRSLARALVSLGEMPRALSTAIESVRLAQAMAGGRFLSIAQLVRAGHADILAAAGDLDGAEREARAALDGTAAHPLTRASGLTVLARTALDRRQAGEALALARQAVAIVDASGTSCDGDVAPRLVHAEALGAAGHADDARRAVFALKQRVLDRSESIPEREYRESFLRAVPENARVLALADQDAPWHRGSE